MNTFARATKALGAALGIPLAIPLFRLATLLVLLVRGWLGMAVAGQFLAHHRSG